MPSVQPLIMSKNHLYAIIGICIFIVLISSIIKLRYWIVAKKNGASPQLLLLQYFRWYSAYALWDTMNDAERTFMKVNNFTNRFIWISLILGAMAGYLIMQTLTQ